MKKIICLIVVLSALSFMHSIDAQSGTYTMTTQYPAANGYYDDLRSRGVFTLEPQAALPSGCDEGEMYYSLTNGVEVCDDAGNWGPMAGLWEANGRMIYPAGTATNNYLVGIGTETPTGPLHVDGGQAASFINGEDITLTGQDGGGGIGDTDGGSLVLTPGVGQGAGVDGRVLINGKLGIQAGTPQTFPLKIGDKVGNDGGILAVGTTDGTLNGPDLSDNAGVQLFWYPKLATFRVGESVGDTWYDGEMGMYSFGAGFDNLARGQASISMGQSTDATGAWAVSIGDHTAALNTRTLALGYRAQANAINSVAIMTDNNNTALFGANRAYSWALGFDVEASQDYSFAIGRNSDTQEGVDGNQDAIAMGRFTTSTGSASLAVNRNTTADGDFSTAMGMNTTAQAQASLVMGQWNVISGTLNNWVPTEPVFVIGNGINDSNRSNAFTVLKNGKVGINVDNPTGWFEISGSAAAQWANGANTIIRAQNGGFALGPGKTDGGNIVLVPGIHKGGITGVDGRVQIQDVMNLNPRAIKPSGACSAGDIYFDSSDDDFCLCDSTGWFSLRGGGTCL